MPFAFKVSSRVLVADKDRVLIGLNQVCIELISCLGAVWHVYACSVLTSRK